MVSNDDGSAGRPRASGTRSAPSAERTGRGPFDRILRTDDGHEPPGGNDRAAIYVGGTIIGLAILLLILLLPPVSILSGDGGGSDIFQSPGVADEYTSDPVSGMPDLPDGLEAASVIFNLSAPEGQQGASRVTVPLKEPQTDNRNLGLYTYVGEDWQRLSDVTLIAGGEAARGDVQSLPGNVAILKRTQSTFEVAGVLPAGTEIDPDAASALTILHPLVFLTAPDGGLAGTPPAVPPAGYNVVPGVVTLDPAVINNILRSSDLQAAHATAIADTVRNGNYQGINLDYRLVDPNLREDFTEFIRLVAGALHQDSRTLTLTLPMPATADGEVDAGAYDWQALGTEADVLQVAAPDLDEELFFQRSQAALDYITDLVPPAKLMLMVNSLAVERGSEGLRAMPLDEALAIAAAVDVRSTDGITPSEQVQLVATNLSPSEGASGMAWDDVARAVTFRYTGGGGQRTVWLANEFSVAFRLELVSRYELGGVVFSDVSTAVADIWPPVQQFADTGNLTLVKPNGELLAPVWAVAENGGAINPTAGPSVTWTAPAEAGTFEITIIVSDGIERVGQTLPLDVQPAPPAE